MDSKGKKKNDAPNEKREQLFLVSKTARELREKMMKNAADEMVLYMLTRQPLNYFIRRIYGLENAELRSFWEWKKDDYTIRKGEHAHLFWGQPLRVKPKQEDMPETDLPDEQRNNYEFYPLCFLFDETQVFRRDKNLPDAEPETEVVEAATFECVEM